MALCSHVNTILLGKEPEPETYMQPGRSCHKTYVVLLTLIVFLSCATPGFQAGDLKSSLPVTAPAVLAEIHSIAVPPFFGDTVQWRQLTHEALAEARNRLSVIPLQKVDSAAGAMKKEFQLAGADARIEPLQKLGRKLQADAVVNGVVLQKDRPEIVIQIISSQDGRVLFWQSAEFSMKEGPSVQGQKELLAQILGPVKDLAGTRDKKVTAPAHSPASEIRPAVEPRHEAEPQPKPAQPQKSDRRQKPEKKKSSPLPPADDNLSPM